MLNQSLNSNAIYFLDLRFCKNGLMNAKINPARKMNKLTKATITPVFRLDSAMEGIAMAVRINKIKPVSIKMLGRQPFLDFSPAIFFLLMIILTEITLSHNFNLQYG